MIHPDHPGVYLAGVECDGATYHNSPSARDRDRVRHIILENLGWRLVRLWSIDYFQDPEEAITKIDRRLNEILDQDRNIDEASIADKNCQNEADSTLSIEESEAEYIKETDDNIIVAAPPSMKKIELFTEDGRAINFDYSQYFDKDYQSTLIQIAKRILSQKNGITLHELTLDMANLHGVTRTSKKQQIHVIELIKPWAGLIRDGIHKPVVWLCPEDVVDEIPWRGHQAWGEKREWSDIPYPEIKSLVRLALKHSPSDPVSYIFDVFKLKRRHEKTLEQFQSWVDKMTL